MSNNPKRRLPEADKPAPAVVKSDLEAFSSRLYNILLDRQMSQADLARKMWGAVKIDGKGYESAAGRDRISSWVNGKSMPGPQNLRRLAEVLEIPETELAPTLAASAIDRQEPEFQVTAIAGHSDKVLLRMRKLLPMDLAAKIHLMIAEYEKSK